MGRDPTSAKPTGHQCGRRADPSPPAGRADAIADLAGEDQAALLPRLDIPATADLLEELEAEVDVMSAPLIATLFDASGLSIYMTVAGFILTEI